MPSRCRQGDVIQRLKICWWILKKRLTLSAYTRLAIPLHSTGALVFFQLNLVNCKLAHQLYLCSCFVLNIGCSYNCMVKGGLCWVSSLLGEQQIAGFGICCKLDFLNELLGPCRKSDWCFSREVLILSELLEVLIVQVLVWKWIERLPELESQIGFLIQRL